MGYLSNTPKPADDKKIGTAEITNDIAEVLDDADKSTSLLDFWHKLDKHKLALYIVLLAGFIYTAVNHYYQNHADHVVTSRTAPFVPGGDTVVKIDGPVAFYQVTPPIPPLPPLPPVPATITAPATGYPGASVTIKWTEAKNTTVSVTDKIGLATVSSSTVVKQNNSFLVWRYTSGIDGSASFDLAQVSPGNYQWQIQDDKQNITASVPFTVAANPPPSPLPPGPTPSKIAKSISFIYDPSNATTNAVVAPIIDSPALKTFTTTNSINTYSVYVADVANYKGFAAVVASIGVPCVIVQDADANIIASATLTNLADLQTLLNNYVTSKGK